jgi:S-adenosylmethionine:tRNA-ribosyltransferase-isomerase (queuine synthetase)
MINLVKIPLLIAVYLFCNPIKELVKTLAAEELVKHGWEKNYGTDWVAGRIASQVIKLVTSKADNSRRQLLLESCKKKMVEKGLKVMGSKALQPYIKSSRQSLEKEKRLLSRQGLYALYWFSLLIFFFFFKRIFVVNDLA